MTHDLALDTVHATAIEAVRDYDICGGGGDHAPRPRVGMS